MKVILVNGSPHEKGCTFTALSEAEKTLNEERIDTELFWIGNKPISGCRACEACGKLGRCVISDDRVNEFTARLDEFDGYIFGCPVHFAGMAGNMVSFMDRAFYSVSRSGKSPFMFKPVAGVVSARRAGTTAALDQLNKYLEYMQTVQITSRYWNMVHGNTPEEVLQDAEGLQIMRVLGRNMAWFLKLKEAGIKAGVPFPKLEDERLQTNFIR